MVPVLALPAAVSPPPPQATREPTNTVAKVNFIVFITHLLIYSIFFTLHLKARIQQYVTCQKIGLNKRKYIYLYA
jgi:hypothetical protein